MPTTSGVNPITGQSTTPATSSSAATGLTSNDFMHLMITQLQHQDPLNPTDSNALLQQIAQISTLQSNQGLQTTLTGLTLQQSIGAGGNLIGKAVQGIDGNGNQIGGNVTGVQVQDSQVYLTLDNDTSKIVPMQNITSITQPVVAAAANGTTNGTTTPPTPTAAGIAQQIMQALSGLTS